MLNRKKVLAMILIFTMTFANFAYVTESIATTSFVSLFGVDFASNENIEFEAYLANAEENSNAMVCDVNEEDLAVKLQLDVKESGYLKDAKIEIKAEDEKELNFAIKEDNKVAESINIQSLENNVLNLNKIDNSFEKLEISIPIEYEMEEYINEEKLCNTAKVVLSGIYVDENGKENDISEEIDLTLAWKDERSVKVENEISKYIQFGSDGVILQTIVKVDSSNENKNSLPTKETTLNIDVPKINNVAPTEVSVVANSTVGTNGKSVGEVEFSADNWTYNQEESKVNIKVENKKQLVDVNKTDDYLKVEGEEVKQEERYYSVAGMDEYVITYTFQKLELSDEMKISTKSEVELTTFTGVEADGNVNKISSESTNEFILTGQTGNIVSYNIENETKDISKVYAYLNKEAEYNSKTAINISYKDIVEEIRVEDVQNYYIDKQGNKVEADDIYYKQISINKENFNEILGEEGNLEILDIAGNVLATVNKDSATDENGNYVVNFSNKASKITVKTSAPVNTGNLIISSKKAVSNISIEKADYANIEYLATDTIQKVKFEYVTELADLGNCTTKTKLNDTTTDFNLIVDRESLSTVTPNSNVEIRLELNNDEITSDIYGASVFEIEMPEYVTAMNVTNASMLYGEGLNISNVEKYVRDGKNIIKVTVDGKQVDLNSGVLTNGANIVLNVDITVDKYTPSVDAMVKAYAINSEATNYANPVEYAINDNTVCAYKEAKIEYSAPSGVVAINTIANYNALGTALTSIKQGEQVDYIDIYSQAKNSTMEVVVVNNNDNQVSDLAILGRIPFKGVKDLTTGEDLGTTVDTKMVSGIVSNEENIGDFTVYYSENKDATKDLTDTSNNWVTNSESLENVKSYLIVPNDANYQMESKQVLKFTYEYQIPENLDHNEDIYGTFLAYYINKEENGQNEEIAKPDLVGLTTGAGPELDMEIKTDKKEVNSLDKISATITVKNTGVDIVQNVATNISIPENTTFISAESNRDTVSTTYADGKVVVADEQLSKEGSFDVVVMLKVNNIDEFDSDKIVIDAVTNAKDLSKELNIKSEEITIRRAELALQQAMDYEQGDEVFKKDTELNFILLPENLTEKDIKNVKVETQLPKELKFENASMYQENEAGEIVELENANYIENTNKVEWNIDEVKANEMKTLYLNVKVGELDSGLTENTVKISSQISAQELENTYNAEDLDINLGRSSLSITQTSSTPTYVQEEDIINYTFTIKNEGGTPANDIVLEDVVPDGLVIQEISYSLNGEEFKNTISEKENAEIELTIPEKTAVDVNVKAYALSLEGTAEKTVTNEAIITTDNDEQIKSNTVTHIIKSTGVIGSEEEASENNGVNSSTTTTTDITKSYKITGIAWNDENSNGMRDNSEKRMENVTAMLVDSATGVIKATTTTNNNGEYTFNGLSNGVYLVLFKYDTTLYTTTTYRKEGIETSINSDVVTTKIEQDGRKENGAVTDVIQVNGANVSNVDIGLVETEKFSLELDKSITKVTVQNSEGTKTEEFDKTKLAKYDIAAKYLSGTTVYVEYTMTVKNNGDLSGFASEIVDYIPKGMTFNSNLNPDWYTGTDGNLYTKALADIELAKGESREIKLVLTKQMTAENTGLVSNTAEIADDFNIYGVSDTNSKPINKAQGEDDMSTADTILTVKTGESLIYVSAIIISLIIGSAVAFIVYERVLKNKRKGGV